MMDEEEDQQVEIAEQHQRTPCFASLPPWHPYVAWHRSVFSETDWFLSRMLSMPHVSALVITVTLAIILVSDLFLIQCPHVLRQEWVPSFLHENAQRNKFYDDT